MCQGTATPMTDYWRNVANQGRGSSMTRALHDACDKIERLTDALEKFATLDSVKDGCKSNERIRADFLGACPEYIGYAKAARALLARMEADK